MDQDPRIPSASSTGAGQRIAAGWFPDPWGSAALRWWDGNGWTATTAPAVGWDQESTTRPRRPALHPAAIAIALVTAGGAAVAAVMMFFLLATGSHGSVNFADHYWTAAQRAAENRVFAFGGVAVAMAGLVFGLVRLKSPVAWRFPALIAAIAIQVVLIWLMTRAHVWGLNMKASPQPR